MPRAMKSPPVAEANKTSPGPETISPSLYKKLHLLQCISKYTAPKETNSKKYEDTPDAQRMKRSFLDQLAYLCDYSKDGSTVTATMLQKRKRGGHALWVAANEGVKPTVRDFLECIVMPGLKCVTKDSRKAVEEELLDKATGLASDRMEFYKDQLLRYSNECLKQLKQNGRSSTESPRLINWIQDLRKYPWHNRLSRVCYEARGDKGEQSLIASQNVAGTQCFADMAHYIGRLGAHVFAVKTIVNAALKVPDIMKGDTEVKYEACPAPQMVKIDLGLAGAYDTVKDILDSHDSHPLEKFQVLQDFVKLDLERDITRQYRSTGTTTMSIKTFVHAELQLCDLANRKDMQFVDNYRYVGCSKPACYFCHRYMNSYPTKKFVEPLSHNKVLLGVRAPVADPSLDINRKRAVILRKAQDIMEWKVEQDILEALGSSNTSIPFQHCSTDGVDRAPSVITTSFDR